MKDCILEIFEKTPFESGVVLLTLGIISLTLRIYFKEPFKMKEHDVMSWKAYVNSWGAIFILLISGIIILLKEV